MWLYQALCLPQQEICFPVGFCVGWPTKFVWSKEIRRDKHNTKTFSLERLHDQCLCDFRGFETGSGPLFGSCNPTTDAIVGGNKLIETKVPEAKSELVVTPGPIVYRDRFLFNPVSGMFFRLSHEAAWVLNEMRSGRGRSEIEIRLAEEFGIDRGTALRDCDRFIDRLERLGISWSCAET